MSKQIKELLTKDETYWVNLLKEYLIEVSSSSHSEVQQKTFRKLSFDRFPKGNYVCVRAVPSIAEQQRMAKEEAARVEQQRKELGPEGLATKGEELNHAMSTNEIPPPPELLTLVPIPDVTNITPLPSTIFERTDDQAVADFQKRFGIDLAKFPVNVTACDIHTTFGYVNTTVTISIITESLIQEHASSLTSADGVFGHQCHID